MEDLMLDDLKKVKNNSISIKERTNRYVYLSNGNKYRAKLWGFASVALNKAFQIEEEQQDIIDDLTANIEELSDSRFLESVVQEKSWRLQPIQALRYIIIQDMNDGYYTWVFASKSTSHGDLENDYQQAHPKDDVRAVGGGFYSYLYANASHKDNPILELFGVSDSFGLRKDIYYEAISCIEDDIFIDDSKLESHWASLAEQKRLNDEENARIIADANEYREAYCRGLLFLFNEGNFPFTYEGTEYDYNFAHRELSDHYKKTGDEDFYMLPF